MTALPRDLGDGLILRAGTPADGEPLATFNADVIRMQDMAEPQASLGEWTRDLFEGRHPTARPTDATIVEDTRTHAIVSSMILIPQTWSYDGIRIPVGQPELVGTRADYRGRGLVRAQFDVVHARSEGRGDLMQAITGVPWFYRQFGYELAVPRGGGGRVFPGQLAGFPPSPLRVRAARDTDAGFLAALDGEAAARHAVWVPRGVEEWRYELTGHRKRSAARHVIVIVESASGEPVGAVMLRIDLSGGALGVAYLEAKSGTSWRELTVAALHHLRETGEALAKDRKQPFEGVNLWFLGPDHPICEVLRLGNVDTWSRYALYTRVADVAAFLHAVTPVLERRLAGSPVAGHTAEIRLGFYRDGVRVVFESGRLKDVARWMPSRAVIGQEEGLGTTDPGRPHALFPDLTFLQLLFGMRSIDELTAWYPDCIVRTGETRALLNALFPRRPSHVLGLM